MHVIVFNFSFTFGIPKFGIATPSAEGVPGVVTTVSSSEEKENKPLFSFQGKLLNSSMSSRLSKV